MNSYLEVSMPSLKHIHFHPNQSVRTSACLPGCCLGHSILIHEGRRKTSPRIAAFLQPRPPRHSLCSQRGTAHPARGMFSLLLATTAALGLCRWLSFWGKLSSAAEQDDMPESKRWLQGARGIRKATKQEQEARGDPSYSA